MAPPAKKSKTSAPAPAGARGGLQKLFAAQGVPKAPAAEAAAEMPRESSMQTTPKKATEVIEATPGVTSAPASKKPGAPELTGEQLQRIEENRRRAVELRAKKRALEEGLPPVASSVGTPASPQSAGISTSPADSTAPISKTGEVSDESRPVEPATKANAKAKAKGKAKAKAKAMAIAVEKTMESPQKSQGTSIKDSTPEKMPLPVQEKRLFLPVGRPSGPAASIPDGLFDGKFCADWMQYTGVYTSRLSMLKASVMAEARTLWGGQVPPEAFVSDISHCRREAEVVLAGIFFKDLKARASVIEQFKKNPLCSTLVSAETMAGEVAAPGSLSSEEDVLYIEDATMRVRLQVAPEMLAGFCSGLVAAVKGSAQEKGDFKVSGVVLPRVPVPCTLKRSLADAKEGPFIALVSGLVSPSGAPDSSLGVAHGRLVDFVCAGVPGPLERVLVCGGVLSTSAMALTKDARTSVDDLIGRLAAKTLVQLMPGQADPTNYSLPQMPLHPTLFQKARVSGNVKSVGNPFGGTVEDSGLVLLGHAGQPVEDILRTTRGKTPLSALIMSLEGMHLAPSAPDTLAMPPFAGEDPFVIKDVPHVLFSGGHEKVEHRWLPAARGGEPRSGTQCICVPAFHLQHVVVLVNVRDPRDVRVHDLLG